MLANSRRVQKKKPLAKKPWTGAQSKPSAIMAAKAKNKPKRQRVPKFIFHKVAKDVAKILSLLKEHYPDAHCALKHKNSFELLVATVLSAQCTDERVNKVTPALFAHFPDARSMANADVREVEELIKSTGFFKNKAKNIVGASQVLVSEHKGNVPSDLDSLVQLPGVGRKTANVVLGNAFGLASGVVVDTHVSRLSYRLGWSDNEDAVKIENDLTQLFEKDEWIMLSHYLIFHGRTLCKARSPLCQKCFLFDLCPKNGV